MGLPQSPTTITSTSTSTSPSPHMYSQALQVKLYQAFIFSIPILFSIILFLLFYLFYLKRRSSALPPPTTTMILPTTFRHDTNFISSERCDMGLKGELQEKLPKVIFNQTLREKDSTCCVCLGEFEIQEELVEMGLCKHLFHVECIKHWLQSNATCPLCRSSVLSSPSYLTSKSTITINAQQPLHVPSTILLEQLPSSSSSSSSSNIVSRVSNQNETDQSFDLHIVVQD